MIRLRADVAAPLLDDPGVDAVRQSLQLALELEHATIPPYLYAYWSLGSSANEPIAAIIRSVVMQEMGHLALVSNLLNSIGGTPVIGTQATTPIYPGVLPGGVDSGLTVKLAPCSLDQIRDVFLGIEEPEDPLSFPVDAQLADDRSITIGQFYKLILQALGQLDSTAFSGAPGKQIVNQEFDRSIIAVTDLASATVAINTIVEEGEGTSTSPDSGDTDDPADKLAHYYRFNQIVEGGNLVPDGTSWIYDRAHSPLTLDESAVAKVPTSPHASDYPAGSPARTLVDTFNQSYVDMLGMLGKGMNGDPTQIDAAVGAMFTLRSQATAMMWPSDGSPAIGPTFEWA